MFDYLKQGIHAVRTFLVGAKVTIANQDFYDAGYKDFEDNVGMERGTLNSRAEYMFHNDTWQGPIDGGIIDEVIGNGIKLQIESPYQEHWDEFAEICDITGRAEMTDMAKVVLGTSLRVGDSFTYVRFTKKGLKLQLLEAHQLCEYKGKNGIEINSDGSIRGYYFYKDEYKTEIQFIKAKFIVHFYELNSASQYRGVSDYNRSITTSKDLMGFNDSTVKKARAISNVAYAVKGGKHNPLANPLGVQKVAQELRTPIKSIGGLKVHYLRENEEIQTLDSSKDGASYKEYTDVGGSAIARSRQVSVAWAKRDYRGMSFSSHKAEKMQNDKRFDGIGDRLTRYWYKPIYRLWREYMALSGQLDSRKVTTVWIQPYRPSVQPDKEIATISKKLDRDIINIFDACKAMGTDYQDNLIKNKEAIELQKKIYGDDYEYMKNRELELEKYEMKLRHKAQKRSKDDRKRKKKAKKTATKTA